MNKNLVSSILSFGVILISLVMLAGCQLTEQVVEAAALPQGTGTIYTMERNRFNTAETSTANVSAAVHAADRKFFSDNYLGMAGTESLVQADAADRKFFSDNYLGMAGTDSLAQADAADRKFFSDNYLGLLNGGTIDYEQAAESSAFRWQAIATGYEKAGLLNDGMDAGDIKAFRWQAIAQGYERLGLLNHK